MKGNERGVLIGMVVVALLLIFGAYQFFYSADVEKADQVQAEINSLKVRMDELNAKNANRSMYEAGISNSTDIIDTVLSLYGPGTSPEKIIMYVVDMCNKTGCAVTDVAFKDPTLIYSSETAEEGQTPEIQIFQSGMTAELTCGYTQLKKITDFINSYPERMNVENFTTSFDAQLGSLSVTMNVNMYGVTDKNHVYVAPTVEDIELGNTNIFKTIEIAAEEEELAEETEEGSNSTTVTPDNNVSEENNDTEE